MISRSACLKIAPDQRFTRKEMAALLGVNPDKIVRLIPPVPYSGRPMYWFGKQYHDFIDTQLASLDFKDERTRLGVRRRK